MLIDVVISGDRNVIKKEAEKILKYKDLTHLHLNVIRTYHCEFYVLIIMLKKCRESVEETILAFSNSAIQADCFIITCS